ncbi:MAG: NAD(P)-binding domain-containing protein [Gemmatimonadota bacterium]|nr:NAD(P)-binding domain-containing protein [Gemmatimonadota bacterium]
MSEAAPFQRVAVVGLGVMGGSFARALTGTAAAPEVRGWSHDADERRAALYAGAVMAAPEDLKEALQKADLVAIATPLQAACRLIADIAADTLARDAAETLQNAADELERGDVEAIVALMNRTRSWSDA